MISPLSMTNPGLSYVSRTPQQNRTASDTASTTGREQTAATRDPGQSVLGQMPTVTGKTKTADDTARVKQDESQTKECETCKRRKYQDGSDDPGVSFKTPTSVDPDMAASAVRGHEQEHVTREQAEATREGRRVVSQSVTYHTAICPECGRVYISGGETRTVTKSDTDDAQEAMNRFWDSQEVQGTQRLWGGFDVRA